MRHPIRRTIVMLILMSGSAALVLGPVEPRERRDVTKLLAETRDTPLTALLAPEHAAEHKPAPRPQLAPKPVTLAPPIPLPPVPTRATRVTRRPAVRSRRPATRTMRMLVTAYCPCRKCCGKFSDNVTASGKNIYANGSMFVAADTRILKFGTMVSIPGYRGGRAVPVLDRGGKIRGHRIDVFYLSHSQARKWGKRWLNVKVAL